MHTPTTLAETGFPFQPKTSDRRERSAARRGDWIGGLLLPFRAIYFLIVSVLSIVKN